MTLSRLARTVLFVTTVVVLVLSGVYVLVYLYRWEWNRAIISGLFFVASEIALAVWLVLARLRDLTAVAPPAVSPLTAEPRPVHRFRWLEDSEAGVFVPFLLGGGAILSALAYLVERVARWSAPIAPRADFGSIALEPARTSSGAAHRARRVAVVVAYLVAIAAVTVAIQRIGDATQSRPHVGPLPAATTLSLRIDDRRGDVSARETVENTAALWAACRPVLPDRLDPEATITGLGGHDASLRLVPGISRHAERRLTGCLSDALLSRVRATVVDVARDEPSADPTVQREVEGGWM